VSKPQPEEGRANQQRREEIIELLTEQDRVTVRELAERFAVSAMTVHRDLDALEALGILRKVRGGATAQPTSLYESSLGFRRSRMEAAKRDIAASAARRVTPGASVALDDSTTALAMVPHLARIPEITLVTYFASVIEEVAQLTADTLRLIVVGGSYNHKYHAFGGVMAEQQLLALAVDYSFLSVSAVDPARGAFHQEPDQAALKRTLVHVAHDSSLLVDRTKFGASALHRIVELKEFSAIYVDKSIDAVTVGRLRRGGHSVYVAGTRGRHQETHRERRRDGDSG
jgi:DeoR/GlpR family transcriptional regulator of sugar metabolism